MKKKLAIGILSLAILAGGASSVMGAGAIDPAQASDLKSLYQQMFNIQKQIVDQEAEAGIITKDQATNMKGFIDQKSNLNDEAINNGDVYGYGPGACFDAGRGYGMGRGNSGGFCGGWNQGSNANTTYYNN